MKKWMINAATCDVTQVAEETLKNYESVSINAALVMVSEESKALLHRYNVAVNAAMVLTVPKGITLQTVNGMHEISGTGDFSGNLLVVNGKLTIAQEGLEAAKSYYRIIVNGSALCPKSVAGQLPNLQVNGKLTVYPDGAVVLGETKRIDRMFALRARNKLYFASSKLLFVDEKLDASALAETGATFAAPEAVVLEGMEKDIVPLLPEDCEITVLETGLVYVEDDVNLTEKAIKRMGKRLFVDGDCTIESENAMEEIEKLVVKGTLMLSETLEDRLDEKEILYESIEIVKEYGKVLREKSMVKVTKEMLAEAGEKGLLIRDCGIVKLDEAISAEDIARHMTISDVGVLVCSEEQQGAVETVSMEVGKIGQDTGMNGLFEQKEDTIVTSAAQYVL